MTDDATTGHPYRTPCIPEPDPQVPERAVHDGSVATPVVLTLLVSSLVWAPQQFSTLAGCAVAAGSLAFMWLFARLFELL